MQNKEGQKWPRLSQEKRKHFSINWIFCQSSFNLPKLSCRGKKWYHKQKRVQKNSQKPGSFYQITQNNATLWYVHLWHILNIPSSSPYCEPSCPSCWRSASWSHYDFHFPGLEWQKWQQRCQPSLKASKGEDIHFTKYGCQIKEEWKFA